MLRMIVRLRDTAMDLSMLQTCSAAAESSPEVGSSRISTAGSWITSTPMLTRRRSPPETPRMLSLPMRDAATWVNPSSTIRASTRASFSAMGTTEGSRRRAEYSNVSRTVSMGKSASSCMTYPLIRRKCCLSMGCPLTRMLVDGELGRILPARTSSNVDLPAPLGPATASTSPGRASNVMCFKMYCEGFALIKLSPFLVTNFFLRTILYERSLSSMV